MNDQHVTARQFTGVLDILGDDVASIGAPPDFVERYHAIKAKVVEARDQWRQGQMTDDDVKNFFQTTRDDIDQLAEATR